MKTRRWSQEDLIKAVSGSTSVRQVIQKLGLVPAGGNYKQVQEAIQKYKLSTKHFKGQAWNKGLSIQTRKPKPLKEILKRNSSFQSYKLKKRLLKEGLKQAKCELCGWSKVSPDGRIPVELDHINGDPTDNRITNLRILCPNCHSLQPTHRGRNKKKRYYNA